MRGKYGDTRVEPGVLFDASELDGPGPPPDAIDVQFRAPLSFSLLVDALLDAGRDLDVQTCYRVYEQVIEHTVARLQLACGYVREEEFGDLLPARLEVVALGESRVPGIARVRMHHHLWVGSTAETIEDGRRRTVDRDQLAAGIEQMVEVDYRETLRNRSEEILGVQWGTPRPGALDQIVDPPVHEQIDDQELGVCPSPWGAREVWEQPTPEMLAWESARVARFAEREARGAGWKPAGRLLDY